MIVYQPSPGVSTIPCDGVSPLMLITPTVAVYIIEMNGLHGMILGTQKVGMITFSRETKGNQDTGSMKIVRLHHLWTAQFFSH